MSDWSSDVCASDLRAGPGVLEGRPVSRRLALREPAGPAQYPQGEPCRPAGHRARAVPLHPPRTGPALGAGAVSDRADGAAGHAATALSYLEDPRPGAHLTGRAPGAAPGRRDRKSG